MYQAKCRCSLGISFAPDKLVYALVGDPELPPQFRLGDASGVTLAYDRVSLGGSKGLVRQLGFWIYLAEHIRQGNVSNL